MNSAVKLALAGAMSLASVSGVALAQTTAPMVDTTATTGSTTTMSAEGVSIVRLDSLDNDENRQEHTRLLQLANSSESMTEAQALISSDAAVAAALQTESVQAANVFHVEDAANGGKIIYVK